MPLKKDDLLITGSDDIKKGNDDLIKIDVGNNQNSTT